MLKNVFVKQSAPWLIWCDSLVSATNSLKSLIVPLMNKTVHTIGSCMMPIIYSRRHFASLAADIDVAYKSWKRCKSVVKVFRLWIKCMHGIDIGSEYVCVCVSSCMDICVNLCINLCIYVRLCVFLGRGGLVGGTSKWEDRHVSLQFHQRDPAGVRHGLCRHVHLAGGAPQQPHKWVSANQSATYKNEQLTGSDYNLNDFKFSWHLIEK